MVNNDALRANFVQNSVQFLKKHGFDGLGMHFMKSKFCTNII